MALQITNNYGILEIDGDIKGNNVKSLKKHFEYLLQNKDQVILSLERVKKIDISAVDLLTRLHKKAMSLNKVFYIIGKNNAIINKAFGKNSYVLKNDHL
ncbi:STAS domain-containing protein [Aquimarina sp. RZ0]|uniref:STAS domain-containing protein n=1 Tax=Aquimarina sp. RZ0 TaxID=2607730 RepID=UPI0011F13F18|nr:STAS domain-containing protein [Aquimarina sp. RZ0]KAA1243288.1 STAS domain-containing protein [Aquimarina sp. RZ0]